MSVKRWAIGSRSDSVSLTSNTIRLGAGMSGPFVVRRAAECSQLTVCRRRLGFDQQPQGGVDDLALPLPIPGRADGAAHEVRREEHTRHLQTPSHMGERPDEHRDRGGALLFQGPAEESDRPVADRSSRDQHAAIAALCAQLLRPLRRDLLAQSHLRGGTGEAVVRVGEPDRAPVSASFAFAARLTARYTVERLIFSSSPSPGSPVGLRGDGARRIQG